MCVYIYIYICVCIYRHTYISMYTYICMYAYICTYIIENSAGGIDYVSMCLSVRDMEEWRDRGNGVTGAEYLVH